MESIYSHISFLLVIALLLSFHIIFGYIVPESEIAVLKDIYDLNAGVNWTWKYPTSTYGQIWNFSGNSVLPCNWQGVYCQNVTNNNEMKFIFSVVLTKFSLTGIIPPSISNLSSLVYLELNENQMIGSIPIELCSIKNMTNLLLGQNSFTGTLPPCIFQNLSQLSIVSFIQNKLHGPIPSFVINHNCHLEILALNDNKFTGTIPDSIALVTSLTQLFLGQNLLTGPLDIVSNLHKLFMLSLNGNNFHGTFPDSFKELTALQYLYMHNNYLHGTLPASLGQVTTLTYITTYVNLFTGTLPDELRRLTNMQIFIIDDNYHTGTLPDYIGGWNKIQQLAVYANSFSGMLPSALATLHRLNLLLVQENFFTGSPAQAFNRSIQTDLATIDIASNKFTGEMPEEMFGRQLEDFSSFATCFSGSLPDAICKATAMQRLSLDGIRSECAKPIWPTLPNSPKYSSRVAGSIPYCIWTTFPNLTMLHVSSNGLSGSIPSLLSYANLSDLDLSFNSLRGTIPFNLQSWTKLTNLDLQNNKFSGDIAGLKYLHYSYYDNTQGVSLSLSKNRLSGVIPLAIGSADNINIVDGNLFSCTYKHQPPYKDSDSNNYVCGSNLLDMSLWMFLSVGIVVTLFVVVIVYNIQSRLSWYVPFITILDYLISLSHTIYRNIHVTYILLRSHALLSQYLQKLRRELVDVSTQTPLQQILLQIKYQIFLILWWRSKINQMLLNRNQEKEQLPNLYQFLVSVKVLRNISVLLMLIIVGTTLPLFPILKLYFGTYKIQYRWTISGAFLSGTEPSVAIIALWFALLFVMLSIMSAFIPSELKEFSSLGDRGLSDILPSSNSTRMQDVETRSVATNWTDALDSYSEKVRQTLTTRGTIAMKSLNSAVQYVQKRSVWVSMIALLANIIVVLILKAALVSLLVASDTSFGVKVLLEVCISGVDLMWGACIVPYMINILPLKSASGRMLLKTAMLYVNSIIAPCVVIALADSSCFKGVLISADSVDEEFTFSSCVVYDDDNEGACMDSNSWTSSRPYTPTFLYNYNCYSTVLIEYIPIFMISYSFLTLAIPVATMVLLQRKRHWLFMKLFPGVYYVKSSSSGTISQLSSQDSLAMMHPIGNTQDRIRDESQSLDGDEDVEQAGRGDFTIQQVDISALDTSTADDASTTASIMTASTKERRRDIDTLSLIHRPALFPAFILASTTHHIIVLITFGMMSPALAVTIALVNVTTSLTWETLIGRWLLRDEPISPTSPAFVNICFPNHQPAIGHYSKEMNRLCKSVCCSPRKSFGLLIFGSGIFFALGTLDMAGDQLGWKNALWAPISVMVACVCLFLFFDHHFQDYWKCEKQSNLTAAGVQNTTEVDNNSEPGLDNSSSAGLSRTHYVSNRTANVIITPLHQPMVEEQSKIAGEDRDKIGENGGEIKRMLSLAIES